MKKQGDLLTLLEVDRAKEPAEFMFFSENDHACFTTTEDQIKADFDLSSFYSGSIFGVLASNADEKLVIEYLGEVEHSLAKVRLIPRAMK